MAELTGKVALVTGAASGIGEASARALAAAGAKVAVAALHEERAKPVAESIVADGGEAIAVGFDTSNEEQVAAGLERVIAELGGIDILHNNAALTSVDAMMRDGMIHQLDTELWDQTMAINVRGYMLCTKYAVPSMLQRGGGVVINTSSGAGLQGELVRPSYGTSKAAIIGFTRSVATQYGKMGVRAVTVMPGMTRTPTIEQNVPPAIIEMMVRHSLTPDLPRPEDVANAVVFVASDRAKFITGAVIPVDGGFGIHSPSFADEVAMWAAASGEAGAATADKFRQALDARTRPELAAEDRGLLEDVFASDVVWHGSGIGDEDDARDRDALVERWNEIARNGEAASLSIGDVYADDTHVVAVIEIAAPGGEGRSVRQANIFHLNAEGKASEVWSVPSWGAVALALANGDEIPEHPNLTIFREAEEARARNEFGPDDMKYIERFLRDDVKWISPWGQGPENREQVVQQFHGFNEMTGGTLQMTLYETFADETHAVSLVRLEADNPARPEKHMNAKEANVFHLDKDGKAFEFWGVAEDQAAINDFWM
jgi:NAD(P)-dependent dehydrogenase (short-subunit alcohol dehydrogenase family)